MKAISISALLLLIVIESAIVASGYEITKVIEVGPGGGISLNPAKWSPDGTMLAYFQGWSLYVSDTLGVSREVTHFDLPPNHFEWLSKGEVVVDLMYRPNPRYDHRRFVRVDVNTGEMSTLAEFKDEPGHVAAIRYEGPRMTIEGNVFFYHKVCDTSGTVALTAIFPESKYLERDRNRLPVENHIVMWGPDCVYMITADLADTTIIGPKPYSCRIIQSVTVSPDLSYWLSGGTLCRLADSTCIILDTIEIEAPPDAPYCSFFRPSFNPRGTEVLFTLTCDDGERHMVNRIGTFDYVTYEFTILDPIIGIKGCELPAYAPDGRKIAFLSRGKVYILCRGKSDAVQQK